MLIVWKRTCALTTPTLRSNAVIKDVQRLRIVPGDALVRLRSVGSETERLNSDIYIRRKYWEVSVSAGTSAESAHEQQYSLGRVLDPTDMSRTKRRQLSPWEAGQQPMTSQPIDPNFTVTPAHSSNEVPEGDER